MLVSLHTEAELEANALVPVLQAQCKGACAGCPVGCQEAESSFSTRVMWREEGQLMSYVYYPGKEAACGADWYWEGAFAGSNYRTIRFYVKVNTPSASAPALLAWNALPGSTCKYLRV
jgi:hypothetical protein